MTKRELADLVLKMLGVYAIIQSLPLLGYISSLLGLPSYQSNEFFNQWMFIGLALPFLLMMAAGIVLLRYSRGLASFIVKEDDGVKLNTALSSEDIQAVGFSIVAVLVFLSAIPQLSRFILSLWNAASQHVPEARKPAFVRGAWQSGLSVVVQFSLAILLFFRARGLANLWRRIQIARYVKIEDAGQNTPNES